MIDLSTGNLLLELSKRVLQSTISSQQTARLRTKKYSMIIYQDRNRLVYVFAIELELARECEEICSQLLLSQ